MNVSEPKVLSSVAAARAYGEQMAAAAAALAPFGLALTEGTPTHLRRPAVIRSYEETAGPVVMMPVELDGAVGADDQPKLPPEIATLAEALSAEPLDGSLDLRVLLMPSGWGDSPLIRNLSRDADFELHLHIEPGDLDQAEAVRRRFEIRVARGGWKRRAAGWLERHPFLYSLAVMAEFSLKHPLFGQILCGGPCGISGAWQFTCTMSKTFFSKRQIEHNFFDRPVFHTVRHHHSSAVRKLWRGWESVLRGAMWGPIGLRKAIMAGARRLPRSYFTEPKGVGQAVGGVLLNHLECPKSLRNGACGAPTSEGLCGELLKYGITKPCVFYFRNSRDVRGARMARRLIERAEILRGKGKLSNWTANFFQVTAAFVDRRPLTEHVYPKVDTRVAGASAIVNAMAGRFKGMTLFGSPRHLPAPMSRSRLVLDSASPRGLTLLSAAQAKMKRLPRTVDGRAQALARILSALAAQGGERLAPGEPEERSVYQEVLTRGSQERGERTHNNLRVGAKGQNHAA